MDYDTLSAATRATVPAEAQVVRTSAYERTGDGGGASYRRVNAAPESAGGWFRSADGAYWRYEPDGRGVNVKAFGAAGDAQTDTATYRASGGKADHEAIQAAIDFALFETRGAAVYLPAGVYRLGDALQLGYGAGGFESLTLEGDGPSYRGRMGGTLLVADFSDRPALAVQGARMTRIRKLGLLGQNAGWVLTQKLMARAPRVDDTDIAAWTDPTLHPHATSRYAPYAGVAIDPYSGPAPNPAYPPVSYPARLGPQTQYGKSFSSDVLIEDCYIGGFVVALAIHPSDASGNGDFIRIRNSICELCAYVISAGDGQGREVSAVQCGMSLFHTGVVNTVHGRRQGQLDFTSETTSWENCIQLINIGASAYAGPCRFSGGYSENVWRIGVWGRPG
ncbi:MAG TPA: glycosyl hydrolase family 28-related protein, partial [Caulobacteraceae bacterium]|nr:glycosyl hydrolase family 28-related protein [Caulobacteraceae bacterium]